MLLNFLFLSPDTSVVFNPLYKEEQDNIYSTVSIGDDTEPYEAMEKTLSEHNLSALQLKRVFNINHDNDNCYFIVTSEVITGKSIPVSEFIDDKNISSPYFSTVYQMAKENETPEAKMFECLGHADIKKIKRQGELIEKYTNHPDPDKELAMLRKIAAKQQQMLDDIIKDEDKVFHLVKQMQNYRSLAMRGLAFMAGGHEMHGIFMRLQHLLKSKGDEFSNYLDDFKRLESIFVGQMSVANAQNNREKLTGRSIINYCDKVFNNSISKRITFSEEFANFEASFSVSNDLGLTIISNLIRNGLAFGNAIEVKLVRDKIIVTDNGDGIPPISQHKLFTVGHTTRSRGHGLGLVLCQEAAREMKCDVYLDPDNAHSNLTGASFIFDLKGKASS